MTTTTGGSTAAAAAEQALCERISFLTSMRAQRLEDGDHVTSIAKVEADLRTAVDALVSLRQQQQQPVQQASPDAHPVSPPDPMPPQHQAAAAAAAAAAVVVVPPVGEFTTDFVDARQYNVWYVVGGRDGPLAKQIKRLTQMEETKRISPTTASFLESTLGGGKTTTGGVNSVTTVIVPSNVAWEFEPYARAMADLYRNDNPGRELSVGDVQEAIKYALLENMEALRELILDHVLLGDYAPTRIYDLTSIVLTPEERAALPRGLNIADRPPMKAPTLSGQNLHLKMVQNPRQAGDYFVKAYFHGQVKMAANLMTNTNSNILLSNGNVYYVTRVLVRDFNKLYKNVLKQLGVGGRAGGSADSKLKPIKSDVDLFIDDPLDLSSVDPTQVRVLAALEDIHDRLMAANIVKTAEALRDEIAVQELQAGLMALQNETGMPSESKEALLDHMAKQLASKRSSALAAQVQMTGTLQEHTNAVASLTDKLTAAIAKQTEMDSRVATLERDLTTSRRELMHQVQGNQQLLLQMKEREAPATIAAATINAGTKSPLSASSGSTSPTGSASSESNLGSGDIVRPKDSYLYMDPSNPSTMLVVRKPK